MLRLVHHRHTGRHVPHEHTSFAGLGFMVLLTGIVLTSFGLPAKADPPPPVQEDLVVNASILTSAPVIEQPTEGQRFGVANITVSGTCIQDLAVNVYKNNVLGGSVMCEPTGTFSLQMDLFAGQNTLVARHYRPGPVSPDSNSVNVFYDRPVPPAPPVTPAKPGQAKPPATPAPSQFILRSDKGYQGILPNTKLLWPLIIEGGTAPYALSIDWGDGETEPLNLGEAGTLDLGHVYTKEGNYRIVIKGQDAAGQAAYLQLAVAVRSAVVVQSDKPVGGLLMILWPLYIAMLLVLVAFWLGMKTEKWYITHYLKRGGLA